ncbi:MAG: prohibitin family protein [Pedobacter sp.]|nr:prohibitin family protein [Pedobacter sp.]
MDENLPDIAPSGVKKTTDWLQKRLLTILVAIMVVLMLVLFFYRDIVITVPAGHAGVLFERYGQGTVLDKTYPEGTYVVLPWNRMYIYNIRMQYRTKKITVISNDGLSINLVISVRFFPSLSTLGILHKHIGPNYINMVVMPEIEAKTRDIISKFDPSQLYSVNRESIQDTISKRALKSINEQQIMKGVITKTAPNYVVFENLFIENIMLPKFIVSAIESKLDAEQKALQYEFILSSSQKEANRRGIEAQGLADFRRISGVDVLKWRGIEATEKIATSPNSKVIIMGTDKLPLLLNDNPTAPVKIK